MKTLIFVCTVVFLLLVVFWSAGELLLEFARL
jgi:hypothetical protein